MPLFKARTVSVSIACPPRRVYEFVVDPHNLPRWSFFTTVEPSGDHFIVGTPDGPAQLRFVERNGWGVLDHEVTLPSGARVHVPLRVIPNGSGSELLFTLFQTPEMSDDVVTADAAQVERDLAKLKQILESERA